MKAPSLSTLLRWCGAIVGLGLLLWALGHYSKQYIVPFARWVHGLGAWGPVAFIVAYIVADIVLIPATALSLVSGALFGFVAGSVYTFVGAMLGSLAAFFMGRYVVRPLIVRRFRGDDRFALVESAATQGGVRLVALVRLSPILPYTLLNYALGATRISTRDYAIGTIAILPGTLVYTYYGTVVATLTGLTAGVHRGAALYLLTAAGVVATVAVVVILTGIARRELGAMRGDMRGSPEA